MQTSGKKMRLNTAYTKKDIIIVLICVVLLLLNFGAISSGGRRHAKRVVCLTNLKQLTLAWTQYAYDNDGKIVNGDTEEYGVDPTNPCWVRRDWAPGTTLAEKQQAIKEGAMWPYCKELKLYHCPTGYPGDIRSYGIVDGMNGLRRSGTIAGVHWIKNLEQILKPRKRIVFIDEGWITPDSFAVYYDRELWWENPPVRHGEGTAQSFADGHSEWHRWKGKWTVAKGTTLYSTGSSRPGDPINGEIIPATIDDFHDLYWTQIGCWGELGYTPSYP